MDHLQTMAVFVAVADSGGFAPAARRLNMSPPSVTRAVSDLEAKLGARLLHRTTRSVRLTEAGERYLDEVRPAFDRIAEATEALSTQVEGLVSVSVEGTFAQKWLMPRLGGFQVLAGFAVEMVDVRHARVLNT